MNSHHAPFRLIATSLFACAGAAAAVAQNAPPVKAANSSGLTVAISKVALNQKQLVFQFTIKNNTKARAYIMDAIGDRKQYGFLGSGEQVYQPKQRGINECPDLLSNCTAPLFSGDLARFSYIEPGEMTAFGLTWMALMTVSDKDTFSFTVPLVVRFSSETGDPGQAGGAKGIQFNFPYVHLDRDN